MCEDEASSIPSFGLPPAHLFGASSLPGRRDAAEHRECILVAARRLFAEQGVEQVSMHQIAQEAGVGQGTLYRHFPHKGGLCMVLLEQNITRFQTDALSYFEQVEKQVSIQEQLYHFLLQLLSFTEEHASLLGATLASTAQRRAHYFSSPFYLWIRQVVMVLLRRGIQRQEIHELDIEYTVDVILAPISIDFYHYQRYELGMSQERIAAGIHHVLFALLKTFPKKGQDER